MLATERVSCRHAVWAIWGAASRALSSTQRGDVMNKAGDVAIDPPDDPVEDALIDHHLEEVDEMIKRAQTREAVVRASIQRHPW